jgi:hypothetical protein
MVVCKLTCQHDETLTDTSNGGTKRRNFEVSPNPIFPNQCQIQLPVLASELTPEPAPYPQPSLLPIVWEFTTRHNETLTDMSNGGTGEKKNLKVCTNHPTPESMPDSTPEPVTPVLTPQLTPDPTPFPRPFFRWRGNLQLTTARRWPKQEWRDREEMRRNLKVYAKQTPKSTPDLTPEPMRQWREWGTYYCTTASSRELWVNWFCSTGNKCSRGVYISIHSHRNITATNTVSFGMQGLFVSNLYWLYRFARSFIRLVIPPLLWAMRFNLAHSPFIQQSINILIIIYIYFVMLGIVSTMGSFRERTTDGRSKLDASGR